MVIQMSRSRGNLDMKIDDKYTILEGIQDNKLDNVTVTSCRRRDNGDWLFDFLALVSESRRDLINIA